MGGAQDDINNVGKLRQNVRQGVEHIFDPLVRRKQPEREQHHPAFHAELVLEMGRIDKTYIGNAMRDKIDFGWRCLVNLLQHLSPTLSHDHESGRERD